jgi:hypothetical protein
VHVGPVHFGPMRSAFLLRPSSARFLSSICKKIRWRFIQHEFYIPTP